MITSTGNDKIKNIIKCVKQSKERKKQGVFVVEGVRMFSEIPREFLSETFITEAFYEKYKKLFDDVTYEIVSDNVMEKITDTQTPQGVVSIVKRLEYSLDEVCMGINGDKDRVSAGGKMKSGTAGEEKSDENYPLVMALENIQDPGNLGTILRTAEGAGVSGVIMSSDTVDIYNPKVVRATMGSIFRVPFCYVDNLKEIVEELGSRGFTSYGGHLQGTCFYDFDYRESTIFCVGNEGNGLTDELSNVLDHKILIPMMGNVESLNVATASTVLMFEALRQRRNRF